MKILAALLLLSLVGFAQDKDRDAEPSSAAAPSTCSATTFTGDVKLGMPFAQPIGSGLTYRLLPSAKKSATPAATPTFIGWTIQVVYLEKRGDMEREFSEIMTPPYREAGARNLDTSYGRSIDEVLGADHTINFVTTTLDFAEVNKVLRPILWRSSPPEVREAAHELPRIATGTAKLTILREQLSADAEPKRIQSLSFNVEIYVPSTVKLTPELASRAKTVSCPATKLSEILHDAQQ
jgi:hypothetical protein